MIEAFCKLRYRVLVQLINRVADALGVPRLNNEDTVGNRGLGRRVALATVAYELGGNAACPGRFSNHLSRRNR